MSLSKVILASLIKTFLLIALNAGSCFGQTIEKPTYGVGVCYERSFLKYDMVEDLYKTRPKLYPYRGLAIYLDKSRKHIQSRLSLNITRGEMDLKEGKTTEDITDVGAAGYIYSYQTGYFWRYKSNWTRASCIYSIGGMLRPTQKLNFTISIGAGVEKTLVNNTSIDQYTKYWRSYASTADPQDQFQNITNSGFTASDKININTNPNTIIFQLQLIIQYKLAPNLFCDLSMHYRALANPMYGELNEGYSVTSIGLWGGVKYLIRQ
jgi:hypothetical protein